ncbi:hypothetical protein NW768_001110 [Fusarium equiseti]|uniref:Heterokaryon incompatibility domain-containing protein n=1 Tax=Fusarium equiseti TaxID=61235 RepID=A0ABQ8RPR2_FUSEQ|nr:hypothetical protein NW768_001110 [Fusarium equiseti]
MPPSIEFPHFPYEHLRSPSSIRLLSFVKRPRQLSPPSILGEQLIECVLETVEISAAPAFDLISLIHGNPNSADPADIDEYGPMHRYPIAVNGKMMFVTKNIYEALKMSREVNDPVEKRDELRLETKLITAAENNHRPKVQLLLRQGACVHAQDCFGKTAIHYAAESGHFDIMSLLLDYGASMKVVDSKGHTPLDYLDYTKQGNWNSLEEIAYKMQKTPEERELVPIPEVLRVGRPMWIDAICIDEANVGERESHRSLIGQLYQRAKSLIAWVGVQNGDTTLAIQAMTRILRADGKAVDDVMSDEAAFVNHKMPYEYEKPAIIKLLRRSWFERDDLMHEVAFGRAISVYCGTDSIPFSYIMEFLRREPYYGSFLPPDLQIWALLGNRGSNKRMSLESGADQRKTRRIET